MIFVTNDTAPKTGEYNVLCENGEIFGRIVLRAGDVFPPSVNHNYYFETDLSFMESVYNEIITDQNKNKNFMSLLERV